MAEFVKSIQFHPEMVWATLIGDKTEARILVEDRSRPPYHSGDLIYVREPFAIQKGQYVYRANSLTWNGPWRSAARMPRVAARLFLQVISIHQQWLQDMEGRDAVAAGIPSEWPMPSVFCPVCKGQGVLNRGGLEEPCPHCETALDRYRNFWNVIHRKEPWESDPSVWVIRFQRLAPKESPWVPPERSTLS